MPVIDDRGRLFGKVNLIDAAIVLVVLGLIPLGYASWRIFRTPDVVIQPAAQTVVPANTEGQRLPVAGKNLRPFVRVFIGDAPSRFLFESPNAAEVLLPSLPAGEYDLVLFDDTTEIFRVPKALKVVAALPPVIGAVSPSTLEFTREPQRVVVKGSRFPTDIKVVVGSTPVGATVVSPERIELIVPSLPPGAFDLVFLEGTQELVRAPKALAVSKPVVERLTPGIVDAMRDSQRIEVRGKHFQSSIRAFVGWREVTPQFVTLEQADFVMPALPEGKYDFAIFDASGTQEYARYPRAITVQAPEWVTAVLHMSFVVRPQVLDTVKRAQASDPRGGALPGGAVLQSYKVDQELVGTTKADLKEGKVLLVEGDVLVVASKRVDGLVFEGQALRAGAPFILRTQTYQLNGEILGIDIQTTRVR